MTKWLDRSSWKTSAGGLGVIVSGVSTLLVTLGGDNGTSVEGLTLGIGQILAGIALLCARDNDKRSEDVGAANIRW